MRQTLLFALALAIGGCITVQTNSVRVEERPPSDAPADLGPSLSGEIEVDEFLVDASAEHGETGRAILLDGVDYVVTVEGTFSVWSASQWRSTCAGDPDIGPMHRSVARTGPAGLDAAYAFAVPSGSSMCSRPSPAPNPGWMYRLRPHDDWTLGPTAVPFATDHVYRFPLVGQGAPLRVAVRDVAGHYADNYGRLRVTVRRVSPRSASL